MKNITKETIFKFVGSMFIAGAIVVLAVAINGATGKYASFKQKELNEQINFDCAQTYRYTRTLKDKSVVSYPMDTEYRACLQEKGL